MKKKHVHREPLTSDVIFKAVFGRDTPESKAALIEVLNLVLDRKEDPIVDLTYLNPFSIAEAANEKIIIMDISVKTSKGELIDIEMQVGKLDSYVNRTIFYGCKQLTNGLDSGENYDKMKKSIVVSFIKTKLFPQEVPMHSIFTLREDTTERQLSGILELHYIELGKLTLDKKKPEELNPLEQFCAYLKCSGSEDDAAFVETLVRKGEKVISMTDKVLCKVSEEERLRAIRNSREMGELQIRLERGMAREQGEQLMLISQIQPKIIKGKSLEQIAEELEQREVVIKPIYDTVKANPGADREELLELLKEY